VGERSAGTSKEDGWGCGDEGGDEKEMNGDKGSKHSLTVTLAQSLSGATPTDLFISLHSSPPSL
jgi:hypothetical protein